MIALSMGERGVVTRILATKYGGYLTFASMSAGLESAPGQPTIAELQNMYGNDRLTRDTRVFGIIGNPVKHSRSPVLHNQAMQAARFDGVYVPLLVDDMQSFVSTFAAQDWAGFSVTIPHKVRLLQAAITRRAMSELLWCVAVSFDNKAEDRCVCCINAVVCNAASMPLLSAGSCLSAEPSR